MKILELSKRARDENCGFPKNSHPVHVVLFNKNNGCEKFKLSEDLR